MTTVSDLVRAFLDIRVEPRPGSTIAGPVLCAAYRTWSRWQRVGALSDANFLRVAGAVLGQTGLAGPIEGVTGYGFRDDPILDFLLAETRRQDDACVSANAVHCAFREWAGNRRTLQRGSFHGQVSRHVGPSVSRQFAAGLAIVWPGLTLDNGLPEDAIAPLDLTDAATLRALPFDAREVA
ncbi:hypothetical protein [Methylobacterium oryzihabitans]|uniref:Uncharacterized protein n=1 Tax=Methylobacterium oryzihabitans TaxID=2499852 RepID=A0A3S3U476_9HYPH|nr:hypothetical protein [Methylobacterium oryzihabitans]RVU15214.1 hypothetical protein EOE48_20620 [Methylobacterium oryzihabitans]